MSDDGVRALHLKAHLSPLRAGLFEEFLICLRILGARGTITPTFDLSTLFSRVKSDPFASAIVTQLTCFEFEQQTSGYVEQVLDTYGETLRVYRQFSAEPPPMSVWANPNALKIYRGEIIEKRTDGIRMIHPGCMPKMEIIESQGSSGLNAQRLHRL